MNHMNINSPYFQQSFSQNFKNDNSTAHQRPEVRTVKFLGTRKTYCNKNDISVRYKMGAQTTSHRKDRVVLVDATSGSPGETLAFRFAPRYLAADRTSKVLFKYNFLPPSDPYRYYQFLYVTRQKQVIGSSTKFSIRDIEPDVRSTYADETAPTAVGNSVADKVKADSKTLISDTLTNANADRTDLSSNNGCESSETCLTLQSLTFSRHAHVFSEKCRQMLNTGASIHIETGALIWMADPLKSTMPFNDLFRLPIQLDSVVNFLHLLSQSHNAEVDASRGRAGIQIGAESDKETSIGGASHGRCGGVLLRVASSAAPSSKSSVEKQLKHRASDVAQLSTEVSGKTNIIVRLPGESGRLELHRLFGVNRCSPDPPGFEFSTNSSWTALRSIQHAESSENLRCPVGVVSDAAAENLPLGSRSSTQRLSEQLCQLQQDLDELRVRLDIMGEKAAGQERSADDSFEAQQLSNVAQLLLQLFADLRTQLAEKEDSLSSLQREVLLQARECSRLRGALAAERKRQTALAKCISKLRQAKLRRERDAATNWPRRADRSSKILNSCMSGASIRCTVDAEDVVASPQCTPDVGWLRDEACSFWREPSFRKPSEKNPKQFQREAKGERGGGATTTKSARCKTLAKNPRQLVVESTSTEFRTKSTLGGNAPDAMYYNL